VQKLIVQLTNNCTQRNLIQPSYSVISRMWQSAYLQIHEFRPARLLSALQRALLSSLHTLHYLSPRNTADSVGGALHFLVSSEAKLVVVVSVHPFSGGVKGTLEMSHRRDPVTHHFDLVLAAGNEVVGHRQTVGSPHVPANAPR
jgi:hypothetical protein